MEMETLRAFVLGFRIYSGAEFSRAQVLGSGFTSVTHFNAADVLQCKIQNAQCDLRMNGKEKPPFSRHARSYILSKAFNMLRMSVRQLNGMLLLEDEHLVHES